MGIAGRATQGRKERRAVTEERKTKKAKTGDGREVRGEPPF